MKSAIFVSLVLSALSGAFADPKSQNIVELAEKTPELSILVSALVAAGLADTLSAAGHFTVFAPTNAAFNALPPGTLKVLMEPGSKRELIEILTYHVLPEQVVAGQLISSQNFKTVEGERVEVDVEKGRRSEQVKVGASSKALKNVVSADNLASNGVVHIIDGVLLPPSLSPPAPAPAPPAPKAQNIVELAENTPELSILVGAIAAAGLADTLSAPGHFTVFAPTDTAFKALPAGTLAGLMKPENKKQLADILTYHVLPEKVLSTDLKAFQAVKTVEGKPVHVTKWGGHVKVGASLLSKDLKNVIAADNLASNGVVHIVDGVLLPPDTEDTTITLV